MPRKILKIALKKFQELSNRYDGFINVIVDDWRGYRFIFDTIDVRKCNNNCSNCPLYQLLRNEKINNFSATLYPASKEDKKLFGRQNFLNCKTLKQYQNCYINFLSKKTLNQEEIKKELNLIRNLSIIYTQRSKPKIIEEKFKQLIIKKALRLSNKKKREIIKNAISFFDIHFNKEVKK